MASLTLNKREEVLDKILEDRFTRPIAESWQDLYELEQKKKITDKMRQKMMERLWEKVSSQIKEEFFID